MSKISTKDVINYSAFITEQDGYVKRSENSSVICTADKVLDAIELHGVNEDDISDVKDRVNEWLKYVNDIDHQTGEYFDNVRSEICKPTVDETKIGLIASSFASFDRYKLYKIKNDRDKQSDFLGEEGDKITFTISEYKLVKSGNSKFGNQGKYYLYKIKDESNNIIIWFADHDCEDEFSNHEKATATITKLNTFNEVKQTNVSKLRFL